ncbi:MAG: Gfo/Idh/MocA family oxidoreductase [Gammaproteobacteria bacterium]|nr:Gfo/Idh/MocA family oxidoreductase [Gammaproteobacteria bacterium]
MSHSYNVAIIGAGIGQAHAEAYHQLADRFSVSVVCDIDKPRAQTIADTLPNCRVTDDINTILTDPDISVIDICLPPHLHLDFCLKALAAGKHVVCEKPLVSSLAEADKLAGAVAEAPGSLFPVFQYRYGLGATQMKALIDDGIAGTPFVGTLETHWNRDAAYYEPEWRGTWKGESGGAILGHAIHIHDWLNFIFGPVASVYAELATRVNTIEVEDCGSLTIRMQSGALVTSSITLGAANDTSRLRFCFEGLTAESGSAPYTPAEDTWTFIARAPQSQSKIDKLLSNIEPTPGGYVGLFNAIANALDGDASSAVLLEDGRRSLEFVTAVYSSARTGRPVELPLQSSHPLYDNWVP